MKCDFDINILSSSSQGNAILFDKSVLLDTGVPFKKLLPLNLKAVLLTHIHGDHFNKSTIRKIHVAKNITKFICGIFLKNELLEMGLPRKNIVIVEPGKQYKIDDIIFSPISLYHDVENFGYRFMKNGYKHIHATDTFSLDGITAKDYDSATIEANHCIDTAMEIIKQKKNDREFCHLERAIRTHLSVQKSVQFINDNDIKKYIPVHVGSSTLDQVVQYIKKNKDQENEWSK